MKKLLLTTIILLGMSFGAYAQQYRANGIGWTLRLFSNEEVNEEELGMRLFEDNQNPWDEEMDINLDFSTIPGFNGGGLFGRGKSMYTGMGNGFRNGTGIGLFLPGSHGALGDSEAPLGSGVVVLLGMGAAYLVGKRRKED